jgi:glycosyltransferase involved in cell wall biosynthesis
MKVLHLPSGAGGNAWALAQGERALGLESFVLYTHADWLGYRSDFNLHLENADFFREFVKLFKTLRSIRKRYDIFHFNWGSSLMRTGKLGFPHADLPFYSKEARLFATYNGCDARQKYPTVARTAISACHNPDCYGGMCNSGRMDEIRRKNIQRMNRYVQQLWAVNPDLMYFLPKEKASFLPYAVLMEDGRPQKPGFTQRVLKIAHAPTNRAAKGSESIIKALEEVRRKRGQRIEVMLIENVRHEKALSLYAEADLVVDQILTGWYGGFAVEAMSMGKPVICRIAEEDLHFIPKQMANDLRDAILNADQSNLADVVSLCIENRDLLAAKGEAGVQYARTWHDPKFVASITKEAYERSLAE